jgi:hypothetical protein
MHQQHETTGPGFYAIRSGLDQRLPTAVDGGFGANNTNGWTFYSIFGSGNDTAEPDSDRKAAFDPTKGSLFPYVRAVGVYACPSDGEAKAANKAMPRIPVFSKKVRPPAAAAAMSATAVKEKNSIVRNPSEWMLLGEESRDSTRETSTDDAYLNLKNARKVRHFRIIFLNATRLVQSSRLSMGTRNGIRTTLCWKIASKSVARISAAGSAKTSATAAPPHPVYDASHLMSTH